MGSVAARARPLYESCAPSGGTATTMTRPADTSRSSLRSPPWWLALLGLLVAAVGCDRQPSQPAGASSPSLPTSVAATSASTARETVRSIESDRGPRVAAGIPYVEVLTAGAAADDPLPLVVAIHGLGDRPERFGWLLRELPVPARIIVPQGLDPWHDGFSWFPIRVWNPDPTRVARGVRRATDALAKAIEELQQRHQQPGKVVVTGFSQGGMLSFALAVHRPELVAAAFPIAGWLPQSLAPEGSPPPGSPPIRAFHGVDDELLPIEPTRRLVGAMRSRGFDVELRELSQTGHAVTDDIRRELLEQLEASLRQAPAPPRPPRPRSTSAAPSRLPGE